MKISYPESSIQRLSADTSRPSDGQLREIETDLSAAENAFLFRFDDLLRERVIRGLLTAAAGIACLFVFQLTLYKLATADLYIDYLIDISRILVGTLLGFAVITVFELTKKSTIEEIPELIRIAFGPIWSELLTSIALSLIIGGLIGARLLSFEVANVNFKEIWSNHDARAAIILGIFSSIASEKALSVVKGLINRLKI